MGCLLRKMSGHVIPKESELRRDTQQHPEMRMNLSCRVTLLQLATVF